MGCHIIKADLFGSNINFFSSSLETLSTEDPPPPKPRNWFPKPQDNNKIALCNKYRLAPYSKGPLRLPTSFRETSTQTDASKKALFEELLALIEQDSQPCWCQRESDLDLESETDSERSIEFLGSSWSDEGGNTPPKTPPMGSEKSPYPSQFLF
nr:ORF3 [Torque teno Leptonychotes weddellii virus 2]